MVVQMDEVASLVCVCVSECKIEMKEALYKIC